MNQKWLLLIVIDTAGYQNFMNESASKIMSFYMFWLCKEPVVNNLADIHHKYY